MNNDSIGKLRLRRSAYRVTLLSDRLSCQAASRLFRDFLQDFDDVLARPWVLNVQTATFTRGRAAIPDSASNLPANGCSRPM